MGFGKNYRELDNNPKSPPRIYDDGRRFGVIGSTSCGDVYDVTIMGENPLNDPSKYGETKESLLKKIERAAEKSSRNVKLGWGYKQGVIVDDGRHYITPKPGVEVVVVMPKPIQI